MSENAEGLKNSEEVAAAAQMEFDVDLNDRGLVHAKAVALNKEAQKSHDYSKVERLTRLLEMHDRMTGKGEEGAARKAA